MKKIVFTVTTDITYDQRMNRICTSLSRNYRVELVGRKNPSSPPLLPNSFQQTRLYCFFAKGKWFYIEYNIRLFFYLLFTKTDAICAIDLDTLLASYCSSKWKRKPLIYDAHEYFTEMEEVVTRPLIKKAWTFLERKIVPHVKYAYTVSEGYAHLFEAKYNTPFAVIRNITLLKEVAETEKQLPYILYQGAVNLGRGLESLLHAMKHIDCPLYICGNGDIWESLQQLAVQLGIEKKVKFLGYVEPEPLREYTLHATIGITLFDNKGLSNQYSLANRFFDYLHAGVPQIAMNYEEYQRFNKKFKVALLIDDLESNTIVKAIQTLLSDQSLYQRLKDNCLAARKEYNWQNEEKKLLEFYTTLFSDLAIR